MVSLDELEILAAKLAYSEALRLGSNEMVFLRPRLLVPGALDPVADDVYLTSELAPSADSPLRFLEDPMSIS